MQKLLSRKFGITIATLLSVIFEIQDPRIAAIAGVVGIAYVVTEGLRDKAFAERIAAGVEVGLTEARKASASEESSAATPTTR